MAYIFELLRLLLAWIWSKHSTTSSCPLVIWCWSSSTIHSWLDSRSILTLLSTMAAAVTLWCWLSCRYSTSSPWLISSGRWHTDISRIYIDNYLSWRSRCLAVLLVLVMILLLLLITRGVLSSMTILCSTPVSRDRQLDTTSIGSIQLRGERSSVVDRVVVIVMTRLRCRGVVCHFLNSIIQLSRWQ